MLDGDTNEDVSARSLGLLARHALDAYELDVAGLTLLASDWNCTFRVDTTDGAAYALRVYLPLRRTDEEIRVELAWLDALGDVDGVHVPRPLPARDGSLVVRASEPAVPEPRRVAVFTWAPGNPLGEDPESDLVAAFGEGMARLHRHGRSFAATEGLRVWDSPFPRGEDEPLGDEANADVVPAPERAVFERAADSTRDAIARLGATGEPARIVHGDLHQDNVFVDGERVWFLDFDDCMVAWPVQDLGVTMWETGEDEATWPYRDALREGYERVAPWPERWPGEIDTFAADRGLLKIGHQLGRRALSDSEELRTSVKRHAEAIAWFLERTDDA